MATESPENSGLNLANAQEPWICQRIFSQKVWQNSCFFSFPDFFLIWVYLKICQTAANYDFPIKFFFYNFF